MKRAGFTLIELLVVIAVIALLMGILLPVLHTARQISRAVACASNLKHLSLALTAYDQENGIFPYGFDCSGVGTVIPPPDYPGNSLYDWAGRWWFQFLAPSLGENFGEQPVFWCPSRIVEDLGSKTNILCGNYGVNRAVCKDAVAMGSEFVGTPLGAYQIRPPDATLLIVDSGYSLISWKGATNADIQFFFENPNREGSFYLPGLRINKDRILFPGSEDDAIDGRHPNKTVNAGFADGHVDRVKADDLFVEEIDGSCSNLSPLWLPKRGKAD
jgi:prepilin-type N-terminal cleavage/methylation domain-containing protein/prepilin-type processing-associated H-X9-DG protein